MFQPKPHDICERTFAFSVQIVPICEGLCAVPGARQVLGNQLLRSATSIGAHVEDAQAGQSRPDFISKLSIALKEARETEYWLRLILASQLDTSRQLEAALQEAGELKRILSAILVSAKKQAE
ncbi:MAG TPA: four helix bundle protein [Abditibacterium sp.]|jgi:four helix bundle protein